MMRLPLFTLCFFSVAALAHQGGVEPYFKSIEHRWLGSMAQLEFPDEGAIATEHKLHMPNGNVLGYGDIVSLAGDYYGVPDSPVSDGTSDKDRRGRFLAAFSDLADEANNGCDGTYCANKLLEIFNAEADEHRVSGLEGPVPSRGVGTMASIEYYTGNNFLKLAIRNWDHFLPTSMVAYETGHAEAIAQAIRAKNMPTMKQRVAALELAYAMNAFADHYLTDMFSSGHLRVPRRELFEQSTLASLGGLLAGQMHDEDGRVGLVVRNLEGKTWKMYGDGMLFVPGAQENKAQVKRAVLASVAEVSDAFKTGKATAKENFAIKKIVAVLDEALMNPRNPDLNSSPLYSLDKEGRVTARSPENSLCSYEWTPDWSGVSQLLGYSSGGDGSDCKFNQQLNDGL